MANKYSRYELTPFPSLYVDDRKIDISKLLAQRYDANKQSKDLIDRTLSQMELLDGDKAHGERVKQDVKTLLKDHIKRGDWENSSLVIADAAAAVENDQGLIWANKSMQNRQAEIQAIREARLNGVPMLDFGAKARETHQSYYYDEESGTYMTNVYEPMSETKLDYRSRKENMIGKIPADQLGNITFVGRGKTNKIADLLVEQYIADTKEGIQEYKNIVELQLPQSIPLEERMRMAKNQIKKDFQEAAQQQEFNKVAATKGDDRSSGAGIMPPGVTVHSNTTSEVNTPYSQLDDKIRGLQEDNIALLAHINSEETSDEDKDLYQKNFDANQKLLTTNLKRVAEEHGDKGLLTLEKYEAIEDRFLNNSSWSKEDGQVLLSATQYLTYNHSGGDTDWGKIGINTAIGTGAGAGTGAGLGLAGGPFAPITVPAGTGFGALIGGGGTAIGTFISEWTKDLRGVRDWQRPQEPGLDWNLGLTDSERRQLGEELYGDYDLKDASVEHLNKILGTNFSENDKEELMNMTNAYYTFMTKDTMKDANGNIVERMSGDDLFEQARQKSFVINQPTIGFDSTVEGKNKRTYVKDYIKDINFNNAGISSYGMLPGSGNLENWIADNGGATKLQFENFRPADIVTNTPMVLTFGFEGDGTGNTSRDFHITDPTVVKPGGWVHTLLTENFELGEATYDEMLRQQYDDVGYDNVKVGVTNYVNGQEIPDYITAMAYKDLMYSGGGSEEDLARIIGLMQDTIIKDILITPTVNLAQFPLNAEKQRGVIGANGQWIPFKNMDNSFNQAAWTILQSQPEKLAKLRSTVLNMSIPEFQGHKF